jgi:hypothetical protein
MQLINDAPAANSQSISIASLKLGDVVVLTIGIGCNFLNLPHNPLLPLQREPGKGLGEGFCGDDSIHNQLLL